MEDPTKVHDAVSVKPTRIFLGLRKQLRNIKAAQPTREFACPSFQFVRQTDIHCHLLHLLFHLLFWQSFEPCIEPDVFLHSQPGEEEQAQGTAESTMLGLYLALAFSRNVCLLGKTSFKAKVSRRGYKTGCAQLGPISGCGYSALM